MQHTQKDNVTPETSDERILASSNRTWKILSMELTKIQNLIGF